MLVTVAAALVYGPLLVHRALPMAAQSDVAYTVQFARSYSASFAEGVAYPRWVAAANAGFGAPVFVFYSPLAYAAVGAVARATAGVPLALRLVAFALGLASGFAFLLAARGRFSVLGGAVGAVLFVMLPYHVLDLYVRFAFAEFAAFVWLPLVALLAARLVEQPNARVWLGFVLALAGLVLTHAVSALLAAVAFAPYLAAKAVAARSLRGFAGVAAAVPVALALAAVWVVPVVAERDEVQLGSFLERPQFDWRNNFLLRDGTVEPVKPQAAAAWLTQLLAGGAALALALFRSERGQRGETIALGVLLAWTSVLQTPLSALVWRAVPGLALTAFPWRFGAFTALAASLLVAQALTAPTRGRLRRPVTLAVALAASLPALVLAARIPFTSRYEFDESWLRMPSLRRVVIQEYVPAAVDPSRLEAALGEPRAEPRASLDGAGQLEVLEWEEHERRMHVAAAEPVRLRLRTFDYPGWQAFVDGVRSAHRAAGPLRAIEVDVPPGEHVVTLRFGTTPARTTGAALSVATAIALAGAAVVSFARRLQGDTSRAMIRDSSRT